MLAPKRSFVDILKRKEALKGIMSHNTLAFSSIAVNFNETSQNKSYVLFFEADFIQLSSLSCNLNFLTFFDIIEHRLDNLFMSNFLF